MGTPRRGLSCLRFPSCQFLPKLELESTLLPPGSKAPVTADWQVGTSGSPWLITHQAPSTSSASCSLESHMETGYPPSALPTPSSLLLLTSLCDPHPHSPPPAPRTTPRTCHPHSSPTGREVGEVRRKVCCVHVACMTYTYDLPSVEGLLWARYCAKHDATPFILPPHHP